MNMNNNQKTPESSLKRKLKYGSVAMIFTVVFVAVIVILNAVVTARNKTNPMFIDMTKEQIYGITDASRELLKDIKEPIEIVFLQDIDLYEKNVTGGKMIVNCVQSFAAEYDNITVTSIDINKYPGVANEFKASGISQLSNTSVAVRSKGKPVLLAESSFFVTFQSTGAYGGFAGERTLTAAILRAVSVDSPKVYFTKGHGESFPQQLGDLFVSNGFIVDEIDLNQATQEQINEAKILVICNPQKDFIGASSSDPMAKSEIDKVSSFLNQFGGVMYFSASGLGPFPELDDLMKEYGMAFEHDNVVVDEHKSFNNSPYNLSAHYYVSNNSVGDELTASIRKLPSLPATIVPKAKPIQILNIARDGDVAPVLMSANPLKPKEITSYKENINDKSKSNAEASNLLVVAQKTVYETDGSSKTSLFLVCGSYEFLNYINNNSYSNSDIMLNAMRIMTSKRVGANIDWKRFDSGALKMSLEQQNSWSVIIIIVLPALVSVLGIVVWILRRHS